MKKTILTVSACLAIMLTGCKDKKTEAPAEVITETIDVVEPVSGEQFRIIETEKVEELNKANASKKLLTEEEIIADYCPKEEEIEGDKYTYSITKLSSAEGKTIVQLLSEGLPDDSVEAIKVIMTISKDKDGNLFIEEIKESYRCYDGRGSQEWSSEICL